MVCIVVNSSPPSPVRLFLLMTTSPTGQAEAMVNNSGLNQITKNMNKGTIYRVMDDKCGKYF